MNAKAIENRVLRVRCTEIVPENYLNLIYTQNGTMSAFGPKQTSASALHVSAFGGKADISWCSANASALHMSAFRGKADIGPFDKGNYRSLPRPSRNMSSRRRAACNSLCTAGAGRGICSP